MELVLSAEQRKIEGKKVKNLRLDGVLPAVIFGKGKGSRSLSLGRKEFEQVFSEAGESTLVDLEIESREGQKVLIDEVQYHSVSGEIIHASLRRIDLTKKIKADVPLDLVGESPAIKSGLGILLSLIDEIEVECLPADLPPKIEVDISNLKEVDDAILVKDLPIDHSKVAIELDKDETVAKIDYAEMEEEKEEEEVSEAEAVEGVEATEEKEEASTDKKAETKEEAESEEGTSSN
jgi:large subunit ribosomal protein L25